MRTSIQILYLKVQEILNKHGHHYMQIIAILKINCYGLMIFGMYEIKSSC